MTKFIATIISIATALSGSIGATYASGFILEGKIAEGIGIFVFCFLLSYIIFIVGTENLYSNESPRVQTRDIPDPVFKMTPGIPDPKPNEIRIITLDEGTGTISEMNIAKDSPLRDKLHRDPRGFYYHRQKIEYSRSDKLFHFFAFLIVEGLLCIGFTLWKILGPLLLLSLVCGIISIACWIYWLNDRYDIFKKFRGGK